MHRIRYAAMALLLFSMSATAGGQGAPAPDPSAPPQDVAKVQQDVPITNAMCPVMTDQEIDPTFFVDYRGKRIYFCCAKCRHKFLQDPTPYLVNLVAYTPTDSPDAAQSAGAPGDGKQPQDVGALDSSPAGSEPQKSEPATGSGLPKFLAWLGNFHPASVNFPIGLLVAAALAELLMMVTRRQTYTAAARYCIWIGALGALVAASLGWFYGGLHFLNDDWMLALHRWLGTSTALLALATLVLSEVRHHSADRNRVAHPYRVLLFLTAALVGATGFFGGAMVYGLNHYAW